MATLTDFFNLFGQFAGDTTRSLEENTYIDCRKDPWIVDTTTTHPDNPGSSDNQFLTIDGRNTTIEGLSIRNSSFMEMKFSGTHKPHVIIKNFNFKNFYVLALSSSASLFDLVFNINNENVRFFVTFENCRFSGVVDDINSAQSNLFKFSKPLNYSRAVDLSLSNCSFNIKSSEKARIADETTRLLIENCLFNINTFRENNATSDSSVEYIRPNTMIFSKFTGKAINNSRLKIGGINNAYNVYDIQANGTNGVSLLDMTGSDTCLLNTTKISTGGSAYASKYLLVTQSQMTDKDYLNSIGFPVGDPPSD